MDPKTFEKIINHISSKSINYINKTTLKCNSIFEELNFKTKLMGCDPNVLKKIEVKITECSEATKRMKEYKDELEVIKKSKIFLLENLKNKQLALSREIADNTTLKIGKIGEFRMVQMRKEKNLEIAKNMIMCYKIMTGTNFEYRGPNVSGYIHNKKTNNIVAFQKNTDSFCIYESLRKSLQEDWSFIVEMENKIV